MSTANYLYTPISEKEIRLFSLLPAHSPDDPLECEMDICCRDPPDKLHLPKYEAVSYVWGEGAEVFTQLKVARKDGRHGPAMYFFIQPNLAAALRSFRYLDKRRVLWSDAICIDQKNNEEKSQQLTLMEDTYSKASKVLVWLGEGSPTMTKAIDFVRWITTTGNNCQASRFPEHWTALEELMRMPWFTRRWIVQEIALARQATLYCGKDHISWEQFCDAVTLFQDSHGDIKPAFLTERYSFRKEHLGEVKALGASHLVHMTANLFQKSEEGEIQRRLVTLEGLVSVLTMFDALNSHDIIYAMIPIAKDIKTVSQKDGTVAYGALPVQTPLDVDSEDDSIVDIDENNQGTPSKKRKRTRDSKEERLKSCDAQRIRS